jgi:putative endonuclease
MISQLQEFFFPQDTSKKNTNHTKSFGKSAESMVAQQLKNQKFSILAQNYRIKQGEIDIIAIRDDLVIFVEVKARVHNTFDIGTVITQSKQRKIIYTAQHFLQHNPSFEYKSCRFDVALIEQLLPYPKITYIPNAFSVWQ